MRRLDSLLGVPLCLALGAIERVIRTFRRVPPFFGPGSVRRILVMKFLGVGSVVEASPMFRRLRALNPEADICFLTFADCAPVAGLFGVFDEVRSIRTSSLALFVFDSLSAVFWGWRRRFGLSYDLEFFSKYSYVMSYLIHARIRVGYFVRVLRYVNLLTHCVPYNAHRHVSEAFAAQLDLGEGKADPPALTPVELPQEAEREAARLLDERGFGKEFLVAMNVNTGSLSSLRLWPAEYFGALADRLRDEYGAAFVFVGGVQDRARIGQVMALMRNGARAADLSGLTVAGTLLALLKRVRLLISSDSGPLHMGALMGTPTLSFFGAESARVYGPRGAKHVNLDKELYCSPCLNVYNFKDYDCPYGLRCMKEISPDEAFAAVRRLLSDEPASIV